MSQVWPYLAAILPTIGVAILFWIVIKNLITADRNERAAQARWERENPGRNFADEHSPDSEKRPRR
ncbi:hypothetical protein [Janibacter massiliensis]|uniref:hypothetical protein n=1 Tax=Janibacter massiliensis TaxID=2058291 RepID=UPI000D0F5C35|nr:hypothetical protein [Janibacter massiliensis]